MTDNPQAQEPARAGSPGPLARLRRAADIVTVGLNVVGTVLILAVMVLVNANIGGRVFFQAPISGVPELATLSIVAIVFLQIAQAVREGRLTRTDALLGWLGERSPRARALIETVYNLISAGLLWVLFNASLPLFVKSWTKGTFIGAIGDFTAPVWPVKLIILIGSAMLIVQFLFAAVDGLMTAVGRGDGRPGRGEAE